MKETAARLHARWTALLDCLQAPFLLAVRLYWGWGFLQTGWGKLANPDQVAGYFASLHIPFPHLNALLAGATEALGGLLLLLGLGARLVPVPLLFVLGVAYATAESDSLRAIFHDPDKFTAATPFLFLLACLVVLLFGAGAWSVDSALARRGKKPNLGE